MVLVSAILILSSGAFAQTLHPVEATHTEKIALGAGGTVRIVGSEGELNVEAWDQPDVEVTVSRYTESRPETKESDAMKKAIDSIHVETRKSGEHEVTVTTDLPARSLISRARHGLNGVDIDYRIRVPKDAKLIVQHGTGDVVIAGLAGGIDVKARNAEIYVLLPASNTYSIRAKAKFGTVYSDFDGARQRRFPLASSFEASSGEAAKKVNLETGNGGITLQKSAY